CQHSYVLPLTF
nr:immunoglobulin light chain junction region [Macaca mulatta]